MEQALALVLSVALGVALAASSGLRAFLPLFAAGLAGRWGWVPLHEAFAWLAETPALVALGVAVVVESAADKVPALDHALDVAAAPVRTAAGWLVCAAMLAQLPTWASALCAVVAGGGAALSIHATKSLVRLGSSAATAGVANPLVSLAEDAACLVATVLSLLLSVVAVVVALLAGCWVVYAARRLLRLRRARAAPAA